MNPIIVVNFKTYQQGEKAVKLAKELQKVSRDIIIGVQAADIYEITKATRLRVYAQHVDYFSPGRHTGFVLPEAVKKDRAKGTFLSHSEHPLKFSVLKKTIQRCKKAGLKVMVFAPAYRTAKKIQRLNPDYIIFEPPSLVEGKVSVSKLRPDAIEKLAKKLKVKILVGAGIHTPEDIKTAMKLGAKGVVLSSAITKSRNPQKKMKELMG